MQAAHTIRSKIVTGHSDDRHIQLATGGRKLTLINPFCSSNSNCTADSDQPLPAAEVSHFQKTLNITRRQTKAAALFFRKWKGRRNSIEADLESKLQEIDSSLSDFFVLVDAEFETQRNSKIESRPVVFCKNPAGLIDYMLHHRDIPDDLEFIAKVGMDSGGDFLKITLNLLRDPSSADEINLNMHSASGSSEFADGGVKKLMLLAIVPGVPETHNNLKTILDLLDMKGVRYYAELWI